MTPAITIGSNIYSLRKGARQTQGGLATHLGVTKASMPKGETGR